MGLIRSGAIVVVSCLFFVSIFIGNIFLTLSWSLEYDNVEPIVSEFGRGIVEDVGISTSVQDAYPLMLNYCEYGDGDYVFSSEGVSVNIPCSEISKGPENVVDYGVGQVVDNFYYREYDCSFFECLKSEGQPYVLVSEKSRGYFASNFRFVLTISMVLFVILFLIVQSKSTAFIVSGILISFSALPFRKFNWILGFLPNGDVSDFFLAFFTKSYNVFMIMIIIGVVLFILGISFHFLGWGIRLSEFFRKHLGKVSAPVSEGDKRGEVSFSEHDEINELKREVLKLKEETSKLKKDAVDLIKKKKN